MGVVLQMEEEPKLVLEEAERKNTLVWAGTGEWDCREARSQEAVRCAEIKEGRRQSA